MLSKHTGNFFFYTFTLTYAIYDGVSMRENEEEKLVAKSR